MIETSFRDTDDERTIAFLLAIMKRLRTPVTGCPWDLEQSFDSLVPHTLEEAYEVTDAITRNDMEALKEELGDLLFQVVFHARLGEESGAFDFGDVVQGISRKMIRRHPNIFAHTPTEDAEAQSRLWEEIKEQERRAKGDTGDTAEKGSVLSGVAAALPALTRARKLQDRAARVGFDWEKATDVLDKLHEEIAEVRAEIDAGSAHDRLEDEVGDVLFACANLARKLKVDPESALRRANRKFERRFHHIEHALESQGKKPEQSSLEEMEALWKEAKLLEHKNSVKG